MTSIQTLPKDQARMMLPIVKQLKRPYIREKILNTEMFMFP